MKWFGKSWGAPVNEGEECVVPAGRACGHCKEFIQGDSQGVKLPFSGERDDPPDIPYHLECFEEMLGAGPSKAVPGARALKRDSQRPIMRANGFKGHSVRPPPPGVSLKEGPEDGEPGLKDGPGKK